MATVCEDPRKELAALLNLPENELPLLDYIIEFGLAHRAWEKAGKPRSDKGKREKPEEARLYKALEALRDRTTPARFDDIVDRLRGVTTDDLRAARGARGRVRKEEVA